MIVEEFSQPLLMQQLQEILKKMNFIMHIQLAIKNIKKRNTGHIKMLQAGLIV